MPFAATDLRAARKRVADLLDQGYALDAQIEEARANKRALSADLADALAEVERLEHDAADVEREKVYAKLEQAREDDAAKDAGGGA